MLYYESRETRCTLNLVQSTIADPLASRMFFSWSYKFWTIRLVMEVANPLLQSFGEPPKACLTNPTIPWGTSKEKETRFWHQFVQTFGLLYIVALQFRTFDLPAMQVCNPPETCQAHSQYPPHSTVSTLRENPLLLKFMTNEQISSLTWLRMSSYSYYLFSIT